ncbi:MAG: SurA N-terminal domain-containing protein [Gammaproteobacteria bacterium]|nr:SurA N-terminal domain-containing protein [Gammaproteobacteria bacterium]MCI0590827.1 SurA N-terminal domain-containing protein [Gammaproteobacteria bacterium]
MLQSIHDRAKGWLAVIIVAFICIPFAFWGINYYFGGGDTVVVAKVNDKDLTLRQFQAAYQQYRQQMQAVLGEHFNSLSDDRLKQDALRRLIDSELVVQAGLKAGLRISDEQVRDRVRSFAAFQRDGLFANDLYQQALRNLGYTPARFEEQLRRDMVTEQLHEGITESALVTQYDVDQLTRISDQTRDIAFAIISAEPIRATIEVTDDALNRYYEEHAIQFTTPEQVRIAYIDLSLNDLAKAVDVNEDELRAYYENRKADFAFEEQRSASYIVVQIKEDASEDQVAEARNKATRLLDLAKGGVSFKTIAQEHSNDPGPAIEAGELGFFGRGVMDPVFEKAVFSMQPGEISDPVRTPFGFHIIKLEEIKPARTLPFEEVREQVVQHYRKSQAEHQFFAQADELSNLVFEHPDTLTVASETLGLPIKESAFFERRGGEGITAEPKVIEAAFSEEVLDEGHNSEPIELADDRVVVLRILEHKSELRLPLDTVRSQIIDAIRFDSAKAESDKRGSVILARLKSGETRQTIAAEEGLEWKEVTHVGRGSTEVNQQVLRTAFELGRPTDGNALYGGVGLGTGDHALVAVLNVKDVDPAAVSEEAKKKTREQLLNAHSTGVWDDYVTALRAQAKIRIFSDNM